MKGKRLSKRIDIIEGLTRRISKRNNVGSWSNQDKEDKIEDNEVN